jgi:hypothetical protein
MEKSKKSGRHNRQSSTTQNFKKSMFSKQGQYYKHDPRLVAPELNFFKVINEDFTSNAVDYNLGGTSQLLRQHLSKVASTNSLRQLNPEVATQDELNVLTAEIRQLNEVLEHIHLDSAEHINTYSTAEREFRLKHTVQFLSDLTKLAAFLKSTFTVTFEKLIEFITSKEEKFIILTKPSWAKKNNPIQVTFDALQVLHTENPDCGELGRMRELLEEIHADFKQFNTIANNNLIYSCADLERQLDGMVFKKNMAIRLVNTDIHNQLVANNRARHFYRYGNKVYDAKGRIFAVIMGPDLSQTVIDWNQIDYNRYQPKVPNGSDWVSELRREDVVYKDPATLNSLPPVMVLAQAPDVSVSASNLTDSLEKSVDSNAESEMSLVRKVVHEAVQRTDKAVRQEMERAIRNVNERNFFSK